MVHGVWKYSISIGIWAIPSKQPAILFVNQFPSRYGGRVHNSPPSFESVRFYDDFDPVIDKNWYGETS